VGAKAKRKIQTLIQRHGDLCHLCGFPVEPHPLPTEEKTWKRLHLIASLDHVVPNSLKPFGHPAWYAIAHRWCNSVRGNAPLSERVRELIKTAFVLRFHDQKPKRCPEIKSILQDLEAMKTRGDKISSPPLATLGDFFPGEE
jgi:hypothetical protein